VAKDPHSYSNPEVSRLRHLELDLAVSFKERVLKGTATLTLEPAGKTLVLDTRDLKILKVNGAESGWTVGERDPILGSALTIPLAAGARSVTIEYQTSPEASGLQWLDAAQTAGKRSPFLYSQSQAIHARSWAPLQDTPSVRFTFSARIQAPAPLTPLMAAARLKDGHFHMPTPIPSYLLALAVGELEFRPVGARCGIWAEPPVVEKAAREFEDVEKMVQAAERLYGPYLWGRYDILVLPPSFPFGGMENPRLTFATPTVIAGDKSLVALVSHELAHSWSGNLVTNATWNDMWLNEGFTTYFERRIQEEIYGRARSEMEFALEVGELQEEMKSLKPEDTRLAADYTGRDPDDAMTQVPYVKGALMLRMLEEKYGRTRFDAFLRGYFERYAFQSITTREFLDELGRAFPGEDVSDWLNRPGLPERAPKIGYDFETTPKRTWSTQEWLHYLREFPEDLPAAKMAELDRQWDFMASGNAEIAAQWLRMAIRANYAPAYARLERFLIEVGRRKFVRPLYLELAKTAEGKKRAAAIYRKARPGYHPITAATVDEILK
jgi:aminopeptidase N